MAEATDTTQKRYAAIPDLRRPEELFSLAGKRGVVLGGAGGMAREFCQTLLHAGAELCLVDRDADRLSQRAQELKQLTQREVRTEACDVTDSARLRAAIHSAAHPDAAAGRIDFLVHAVMAKPGDYYHPWAGYPDATWDTVVAANLRSASVAAEAARPWMQPGSSVVLVSSVYGVVGPDQRIYRDCSPRTNPYGGSHPLNTPAVYSAAKAGVIGLVRYLATLLGPDQIRVNALTPGGVFDGQEEAFHQAYTERVPLGRMAKWSEFNAGVLFLTSPASRYVTGTNLVIDGGWTAW